MIICRKIVLSLESKPCSVTGTRLCQRYQALSPVPGSVNGTMLCHWYQALSPVPCYVILSDIYVTRLSAEQLRSAVIRPVRGRVNIIFSVSHMWWSCSCCRQTSRKTDQNPTLRSWDIVCPSLRFTCNY